MKSTVLTLSASLLLSMLSFSQSDHALLSVKLETERTIKKGNAYLLTQQHKDGYWGDPDTPALTALALRAILSDPNRAAGAELSPELTKALDWLVSCQNEDGGIYNKGLATYNTSTSIMALLAADAQKYKEPILKARAFLIGQQADEGIKGATDELFDGGIGYGGSYDHSDMSNTHLALEALYHSRQLARDTEGDEQPELDWEAALTFVSRCQNLQSTNDASEKLGNVANDGGFVYFPGDSKAGEAEQEGKVALRSYGSISYAGLLSLIYADLEQDDPRVKAVVNWLSENYTVDENPGLDQQGLYYYFTTMSKSLAAANLPTLEKDGKTINWRNDLAVKLINGQREDGSWINETARWWENNPILVTSYSSIALQQIHATIPVE